jgi:hypothetical protein
MLSLISKMPFYQISFHIRPKIAVEERLVVADIVAVIKRQHLSCNMRQFGPSRFFQFNAP